jgi:hypothetical protein
MTENVIREEYFRLAAEMSWASDLLAAGDFIAWRGLLVNGYHRAFQLWRAGVPGAADLCAAWDCALFARTGCHFGE